MKSGKQRLDPKPETTPAIKIAESPGAIGTAVAANLWPTLAVIGAIVLLHLYTNGRYGFFPDELQFMSDARRLDWGFVAYPPVAPFLARVSTAIFGISLAGLRLFPTLAQAAALLLVSQMARELGGGRLAQATAALAIGLSPYPLYEGMLFQYTQFDYLVWVLLAYFVIRLLNSDDGRWWLAIGAAEGFGLLTKYTVAYLIAGMFCGMLLTRARRYLRSPWFWGGQALALIIFLPNVIWQFRHDFISYTFIQFIHSRDVSKGLTDGFLAEQFVLCVSPLAAPLCLAGLIGYVRNPRYRMIGWMFIAPLVLFVVTKGRSYYLAPTYPMLAAMGAVMGERWINSISNTSASRKEARLRHESAKPGWPAERTGRQWIAATYLIGLMLWGASVCMVVLPLQSKGWLRDLAMKRSAFLRDEFGWNDLVRTVAGIRDSLPSDEKPGVGVIVDDYGEEGAVEILGSSYRLPEPISTINSGWLRGYPSPAPTPLIVVGFSRDMAAAEFSGCKLAGQNGNSEGIQNDESEQHPDIFLCSSPRQSWPEFWKDSPHFE